MMEATRTSETLVNFYQSTRRYNPEDSHLRTHRRQNLKSYCSAIQIHLLPMAWRFLALGVQEAADMSVAANTLNEQSQTAEMEWFSGC
jgi:hypothetical protein